MELIKIYENNIHMVFGLFEESYIRLLHLSEIPFNKNNLANDINYLGFRLFEMQVSGQNQNTHRGGKNICTSEGMNAKFVKLNDYRNELGRKLEIVHKSNFCDIVVHYQFYDGIKAIKSWVSTTNITDKNIVIEHISSFCLYGLAKQAGLNNYDNIFIWESLNSWYCEGQWQRHALQDYGVYRVNGLHSMARALFSNTGSWSTKERLPMGCIEDTFLHEFMLWQIESGGSWNSEISSCSNDLYINLFGPSGSENQWYKKLAPKKSFDSVQVTITFGLNSIDSSINEMIKYRRIDRLSHKDYESLPIVYNPYMHDAWDYPYANHMHDVIQGASKLGVDIFCVDAGWHDENDIMKYIGLWKDSTERYPDGVANTTKLIRDKHMRAGLWLEIETAGEFSPLLKILDENCFFHRNGCIPINNGRIQLDFSQKQVQDYTRDVVERMLHDYKIDYIKMDYNHDSGAGTEINSDSFGDGLENHIEAYINWLNDVLHAHPNLTIEYCASGGMRLDWKHLRMHPICSTSDEINYTLYPYIITNILAAGTPEQMGIWCYPLDDCDYEQVIFNVVNCLPGRMQLSGKAYKQTGKNKDLLLEGIQYFRDISKDKLICLPCWPLGFATFNQGFACVGLQTPHKIYLAVWNMSEPNDFMKIPVPKGVKNICIGYPKTLDNDPVQFRFEDNNLFVKFSQKNQARMFELSL